jgi:hypothetical protein
MLLFFPTSREAKVQHVCMLCFLQEFLRESRCAQPRTGADGSLTWISAISMACRLQAELTARKARSDQARLEI